jgi:tetratricopeptide (TPR) repeat protein
MDDPTSKRAPRPPARAGKLPLDDPRFAEIEARLLRELEECERSGSFEDLERATWTLLRFYDATAHRRRAVPHVERLASAAGRRGVAAEALLMLGSLMEKEEDFVAAKSYYERGLRIDGEDREVRYFLRNNLAFCLNILGRHAEAEAFCHDAIAILPMRHNAHKNLGIALEGQGQLPEAAECYLRAAELVPMDPRSLAHLEALLETEPGLRAARPDLERRLREARRTAARLGETIH